MAVVRKNNGFSIIEVTVAVAIMLILSVVFLNISDEIEIKGKTELCMSTITVVETALEQFDYFKYQMKHDSLNSPYDNHPDYRLYRFPPDCRDYDGWFGSNTDSFDDTSNYWFDLVEVLEDVTRVEAGTELNIVIDPANYDTQIDEYWKANMAMTVMLSRVPACRDILESISESNVIRKDKTGRTLSIDLESEPRSLFMIADPWGKPLNYKYCYTDDLKMQFPVVVSAGPDGEFDTEDDITNQQ